MYLKSIDLYGFKSFAQKMVFKFDEGITGIVGPNGSGKSNIADAVRWVLGEQSAKMLRGQKMQDVIFAGTETRKPLGYCQVDLTIDNADMRMPIEYAEVTVSRRVYRSGEGEYYINGVECRLKDVQELFMDTGVGKEGYSIIGQGQIDLILSTKPDDRRALFDEAAGIVKFKKRKEGAEKNLAEEKQNLVRLHDIIRELESQLGRLKGESETARQYLKIKEELKAYEINIFVQEAEKLVEGIFDLQMKETLVQEKIDSIKENNQMLRETYDLLAKDIDGLDEQINIQKMDETHKSVEQEKKESQIVLVREQISSLLQATARISAQNEDLFKKTKRLNDENLQFGEQIKSLITQIGLTESIFTKKQQELEVFQKEISSDELEIETIQSNRIERLNELSNVKTQLQRFHTMLENAALMKKNLLERRENLESAFEDLDGEVKNTLHALESHKKHLDGIHIEKAALSVRHDDLIQSRTDIESRLKAETGNLQWAQSKYKALGDLSEQYEGYNLSIKKVMELKRRGAGSASGVLGVVADLIRVDKAYETAIEIALGGSIQNIVTEDEQTAKAMIAYLRDNKFGRATFLPLTSIQSKENRNSVTTKDAGFIGYANELIQFDPKFKKVMEFLLGRVLIVDDMDHAVSLSKKHNYSLRIVTLTGEVINPGGSLTGGAYKNSSSQLLSRKRELEDYSQKIESGKQIVDDLEAQRNKIISGLSEVQESLIHLNKAQTNLTMEQNASQIKLKQLETDLIKLQEERSGIQGELTAIEIQETQIKDSSSQLEGILFGTNTENEQAENQVKSLSEGIQGKKQLRDMLLEELTKIRVDISAAKQQLEHVRANDRRIAADMEELNLQIQKNESEAAQNMLAIGEKETAILSIDDALKLLSQTLRSLQEDILALQQHKHEKAQEQQVIYAQRESQNEEMILLDKEILRLENNRVKLEMQKDNQESYIWNEYELTLKMAAQFKDESLGAFNVLKKQAGELKEAIKKLGDVNVNAIETYREISERHTFLTSQRDDLLLAEEKLKEVIAELNTRMEAQFREKFHEIADKFNEVFRELFGGGKADLELTDEANILECGIDINAQPPGKKLQNMRLLSGGEKAFTAISLLFAIQSLKPSPFCVLDEIEAALDDANVHRFAQYLHKLTHNTQFIIITHRRGTMEAADSLYGITMQEKGVSTQVSVKLLEKDLN